MYGKSFCLNQLCVRVLYSEEKQWIQSLWEHIQRRSFSDSTLRLRRSIKMNTINGDLSMLHQDDSFLNWSNYKKPVLVSQTLMILFFHNSTSQFCIQCAQVVVQNCPFSSSGGWLVLLIPRKFRGFSRLQWWSGFWSAEILVQTRPCTRPSPSWAEEYLTWFFATGRCTPRIGSTSWKEKGTNIGKPQVFEAHLNDLRF